MVSPSTLPASRYRRRILGAGAVLTGLLYVVGAPIFNSRIESDLERRVPAELDAAGFEGISASFSGQDGTLTCRAPLDDPEGARAAAYDIRGVRAIDIDRSCRVNSLVDDADGAGAYGTSVEEPSAEPGTSDAGGDESTADAGDESAADAADASTTTDDAVPTTVGTDHESDLATVRDIVAANPELAFLSVLLDEADIGAGSRTITLFAPSNAAFDAVPADVLGRLQNDPDLLAAVLSHHAVSGAVLSSTLTAGPLTALDGESLSVETGDPITVGGAALVETDIRASNGVVHIVDAVILPADLEVGPDRNLASGAATFDGTTVLLSGTVASEVERSVLLAAANDVVGEASTVDELGVDPETGLDAATTDRVAALLRAMPGNLLSGEAGFDGDTVYATGVNAGPEGRDAFVAAAAAVDVEPALTDPPEATEDDAAELEAELNAFVAENPITFAPSSAVIDDTAFAVIDRVASDARQFTGVSITVEGHTDSDGVPIENLQLSQNRAAAVRAALVERGLPDSAVEAVGFGSEQPVLVDGVEDKAASRRVEFRVVTAA